MEWSEIIAYNFMGIPVIPVAILLLVALFIIKKFFFKGTKRPEFKKLKLMPIIQDEIKYLFDLSEESLEAGKSLNRGSIRLGTIQEMIYFNTTDLKPDALKKFLNAGQKPIIELKDSKKLYGFKVSGSSFMSKLKAKFGIGLNYYFVDEELITINPLQIVIDPYAQYTDYFKIIIFSNRGKSVIEDIAFKKMREIELEELLNFTPKATYLEFEKAKETATLDEIGKIAHKTKEDWLERIRKGKD